MRLLFIVSVPIAPSAITPVPRGEGRRLEGMSFSEAALPAPGGGSLPPQTQQRHRNLLGYGEAGVQRAAAAHIVVVGVGGLGCPALLSLAAAGVGQLTIIDDDVVEASNLARQTLFRSADIGRPKVEAAAEALAGMGARIVPQCIRLTDTNAAELLRGADAVLDTTDRWATRFAVADAAAAREIPLVWGSVLGWDGLLTVFLPGGPGIEALVDRTAMLQATDQPSCATTGVFAPLTAEIGGAMAGEALRLVTGSGAPLAGTVRSWDARHGRVREIPLAPAAVVPSPEPAHQQQTDAAPSTAGVRDTEGRVSIDAVPEQAFILDVRPAAHPDLSLRRPYAHVALEQLESALLNGALDLPDAPIIVACAFGPRSRAAAALLRDAGFSSVSTLDGGVAALSEFAT